MAGIRAVERGTGRSAGKGGKGGPHPMLKKMALVIRPNSMRKGGGRWAQLWKITKNKHFMRQFVHARSLYDFIIGKRQTTICQHKNFPHRSCECKVMNFSIWPMMPSFVCITTSGLMFFVTMKTYELELPHITSTKMLIFKNFLIERYRCALSENSNWICKIASWIHSFSKRRTTFRKTKIVESIRVSSSVVKTKYLTKFDS